MDDLIFRSALLAELNDTKYAWQDYDAVEGALRNIPAVDAVVLPCKVGAVLYRVNNQKYEVYEIEVSREFISEGRMSIFAHPFISETEKATCYEVFDSSEIGKTVFLTREAAEAALERRADNG